MYKKEEYYNAIDENIEKLAILSLAEKDGKVYLEENEKYKKMPEFQVSAIIDKLIRSEIQKFERKEIFMDFIRSSNKILSKVAMVFLIISLCFYTTLAVSADFREIIYKLLLSHEERYTQIHPDYNYYNLFNNTEIYKPLKHAFALTLVPAGFTIENYTVGSDYADISYSTLDKKHYFDFYQNASGSSNLRIDTENADLIKKVTINDSEAILVQKEEVTILTWQIGDTILSLSGTLQEDELIQVGRGIKLLK